MHKIERHIEAIRHRIADAAHAAGRAPDDIRLVAVSKTRSADEIRAAHAAGVRDFGENYLKEALVKIPALGAADVRWHFIGAIQSNKTRDIARHFDWVQTLDRVRVAERLSRDRPPERGPLNVLIQVNIDAEPQKAGVRPGGLAELIDAVLALPALRLRGLMAIPRADAHGSASRASFARMAALFREVDEVRLESLAHWDALSLGMSGDFELAIAEGATMVRIGTSIFGTRTR
jgi:PLP dependent protein